MSDTFVRVARGADGGSTGIVAAMSGPVDARPCCLVEAGYGIGDVIEATPACHALWILGFDVDLLVNRPQAEDVATLFRGHAALRHVWTNPAEVDPTEYDFAVGCNGPAEIVRRMPRPVGFPVTVGDIARHGLLGANLSVARALGYEGEPPPFPLNLGAARSDIAPQTVVVHAGSDARRPFKRWPHWEALCDRIRALGHPVVIVGTDGDRSANGWEWRHDARFDLSLARLASLLRDAHLYLGNDSGVGHLAGAVGTPGLLLFGPTDPLIYAPPSAALDVLDAPARPGEGRHPFAPTFPSLDRLGFEEVLAAVTRRLEIPPRATPGAIPMRRAPPRGDPTLRCPTPAEIEAAPATFDALDALARRATVATVLGSIARRDDAAALAAWRRAATPAFGALQLRTAAVWSAQGTEFGRRRARTHLRLASQAGRPWRAFTRRVTLALAR